MWCVPGIVALQGKELLKDLDIAAEAGPMRTIVKEFKAVSVTRLLTVTFTPTQGKPLLCGIEAALQE